MRTTVSRNNARTAEHLDLDRDVTGALGNAVIVVVRRRAHRPRQATRDAPLECAPIEPTISAASIRARATERRALRLVGLSLACLFGQRRYATVRRIDDQRRQS